jgi:hypothetical protein
MMGDDTDPNVVYLAYGDVMHQLQVFELTLWRFLSRGIKPGMSLDQGIARVARWEGTTLGALVRGLKSQGHWPEGIPEALEGAVRARNYLAHHFLRDYFLVLPSGEVQDKALTQLAELRESIALLEQRVEDHLRSMGVATPDDLTDEERAELEELRPTEWP